jgi:hypothetical protein
MLSKLVIDDDGKPPVTGAPPARDRLRHPPTRH